MHGELETALQDKALTAAQREQLESELDEVQRLAKIVDGLTLLTKADAGQIALAREPVRLDELVREACADAQSLARPHDDPGQRDGLRGVDRDGRPPPPAPVAAQPHRQRHQVQRAARHGHPELAPHVAKSAELAIANTGPGIPAEVLPRVFDPFFRGDASHSQAVEGCGLGLSIARWIVTAHGGTIQLTSEPNRLTTTTVRLPLV